MERDRKRRAMVSFFLLQQPHWQNKKKKVKGGNKERNGQKSGCFDGTKRHYILI